MPTIKQLTTNRSPVNRRSLSQKSSNQSQSSIKSTKLIEIKPKSKNSSVKTVTVNESSSHELLILKSMFELQKKEHEEAFQNLRTEIDIKHSKYEAFVKTYEKDLQQIKMNQKGVNEVLSFLFASHFSFGLPISFNKTSSDDKMFHEELTFLSNRIDKIELDITKMNEVLISLSEVAVANIMKNNINEYVGTNKICDDVCVDKETFKSELECIGHKLKSMNTIIQSDEESMKKMNNQLHVLSAKFINFNAKINEHLMEFNRKKKQQIEISEIIDGDTLPFINNIQNSTEVSSTCCFENSAVNRFRGKLDKHYVSNFIAVRVDFVEVTDLKKFESEMKNQIEQQVGTNSVKRVTINNCKINKNAVHQIDVSVEFVSSMNHGVLNDIQFPTNWTFFANEYQHNRSKQPKKFYHTNRVQRRHGNL